MIHSCNIRTARAALGAVLLSLVAACSDVPSGPAMPASPSLGKEQALPTQADRSIADDGLPTPLPGEKRRRRTLRGADGQTMTMETLLGVDGKPRTVILGRPGGAMVRLTNEWQGGVLVRQVAQVTGAAGSVRMFDSRDLSTEQREAARAQLRREAEQMTRAQAGRLLRIEAEMGVCDSQVKAADLATWQYVGAAAALMLASSTGNLFASTLAWNAFVSSYANYEAKQAELDKCVDAVGKKPLDEY